MEETAPPSPPVDSDIVLMQYEEDGVMYTIKCDKATVETHLSKVSQSTINQYIKDHCNFTHSTTDPEHHARMHSRLWTEPLQSV
jgi:hypothetical protein